jgi:hypothetical protein
VYDALIPYRLHLRFEDGVEGIVDVTEFVPFTGVFAPLKDKTYFARVRVDADIGTICWPNGADLDPDVLYAAVTGEAIDVVKPVGVVGKQPAWSDCVCTISCGNVYLHQARHTFARWVSESTGSIIAQARGDDEGLRAAGGGPVKLDERSRRTGTARRS